MQSMLSTAATRHATIEAALPTAPASSAGAMERFGHFVIHRREDGELDTLGGGGMGITYRAFDTQLERLVALKVIHPQCVHNPEVRSRFAREAKAAARLQHPNIASVLFQGEEAGACFYAMELVAGEDLHHYLQRVGPISPVHALQMAHQIALALVAAAKEGVLHRDLKPGNVMLTSYHEGGAPHLKVIDFGLAKLSSDAPTTFMTGGFLGTPEFASPEQCEEQPLDARSDLYSLGATLWFLLQGSTPFSGSMFSVMRAHVSAPPPFETLAGAPEPLLAVLRRLLAKDREGRPATALDAAREIEQAIQLLAGDRRNYVPLGAALPAAVPVAGGGKRALARRRVLAISIATVVGAAVAAGAALWWSAHRGTAGGGEHRPAFAPAGQGQQSVFAGANPAAPPIVNGLGMQFVAIPGTDASVSIWETRVRDFAAFHNATGQAAATAGKTGAPGWRAPGFPQDGEHPVVWVTTDDATRFCAWLTGEERKAGRIDAMQTYRLPTRFEWDSAFDAAPGQGGGRRPPPPPREDGEFRDGAAPQGRERPPGFEGGDGFRPPPDGPRGEFAGGPPQGQGGPMPGEGGPPFHWRTQMWPPPLGFGNYADESARQAGAAQQVIPAWRDGFAFSAPVGRSQPSARGIYDLSGNVWEMCYDGPPGSSSFGRLGGSWASSTPDDLRLHQMLAVRVGERSAQTGFRCVLERGR